MKKLMILMAAVATSAFALGADSLKNVFDATTASDLAAWNVPGGDGKAKLDNGVLTLATGSDAASYWVKDANNPYAMGDNLYFDVSLGLLGQALDEVPTLPSDAKLALFLLDTTEIDGAPAGTNLYALAKHPTETATVLMKLNADVETLTSEDAFTRLTVQTYKNVFKSGETANSAFVVYQNGGETDEVVSPVKLDCYYTFKDDGSVNWKSPKSVDGSYLSGVLDATVSGKRTCLLLSVKSGVDGQSFTALDFTGNAKIKKVEINDSGFGFIAADVKVTTITLEGVSITVDPASAYDATKGTLSASCKITVTKNPGMEILTYTPMGSNYLEDNGDGTFTYTYAEGNDVSFTAVAACAMVNGKAYETIGEAITALGTLTEAGQSGTLKLSRDIGASDLIDGFLAIGGTVTLDLAGRKIVAPVSSDGLGTVTCSDGSLTIIDSATGGCIESEGEGGVAVCSAEASTILIKSGVFKGQIRDMILEAADEEAQGSEEEPVEGETTTEEGASEEVAASISITGGSFSVEPDKRLIAEGYVATQGDDGYWTVAQGTAMEDGTKNRPYTISTVEDLLQKVIVGANGAGKHYELKNNLVLTDKWEGFGICDNTNNVNAFEGVFDGKGYTISGVTFANNASGNNYRGFFNQIHNATIKNLTVEGNGFGSDIPSGEYGCALLVGCANDSTIENCVAKGTIASATHNVGGIAVRIKDTTIRNCTNEANLTGSYTEVAGIVVLNQGSANACRIEGCVNKGTLTAAGNADKAGKDGLGGIVAYVGDGTLTITACTNEGALVKGEGAHASAKVGQVIGWALNAAVVSGAIAVRSDICTVGDGVVDGLNFARVEADGKVTLVADGEAVANASLKVMAKDAPVVGLKKGESITLDETLATAKIKPPEGCEPKKNGNTYTMVEKSEEVVDPSKEPVVVDSEEAANALTISATSPDAAVVRDEEYAEYFKKVVTPMEGGKYSVAAVLDETVVKAEEVAAELAGKFDKITADGVEVAAKPGLFYSVEQGETLGAMTEGERVMAKGEKVQLKATKYSGSGFYKILVNTSDKPSAE